METHRPGRSIRVLRHESRAHQPALDAPLLLESANPALQRAIATARQVAASDAAVLLTGESGTGKNVLAAAIHTWSPRHAGPFVTIRCATLADHLPERELVRPVKGALPTARTDKLACLETALGGTLFLDEVGDLSLELQGNLIRSLVEQRFERIGIRDSIAPDARIVAATTRDLEAKVRARQFREDLFFRLNVVTIVIPPLRERREDLTVLTDFILTRLAARHRRGTLRLAPAVRDIFASYRWPGNVRELANTLERVVVLSQGEIITAEHLPDGLLSQLPPATSGEPLTSLSLRELERQQIGRVLAESETLDEAATRLGIDPSTLWRKRKRYGFE